MERERRDVKERDEIWITLGWTHARTWPITGREYVGRNERRNASRGIESERETV